MEADIAAPMPRPSVEERARADLKGARPTTRPQRIFRNINLDFLTRKEGFEREGYVPRVGEEKNPHPNSGVTIINGFDIGQHSKDDLARIFGDGTKAYNLLVHYVGLKGAAAQAKLNEIPLRLPLEAGETSPAYIERQVMKYKYNQTAEAWAKQNSEIRFDELPEEYATAIMSVTFQHGASGSPIFLGHAARGDWSAAEAELRNFYPGQPDHWNQDRMTETANYMAQGTRKMSDKFPHLFRKHFSGDFSRQTFDIETSETKEAM
jgi:hypothetical protein